MGNNLGIQDTGGKKKNHTTEYWATTEGLMNRNLNRNYLCAVAYLAIGR